MLNQKKFWMIAGTAGGVLAVGIGAAYSLWNSRRMRLYRLYKRTGKLMYRTGTFLQNLSGVEAPTN